MALAILAFFAGWQVGTGQLAGTLTVEAPPPVNVAYCTKAHGCELRHTNATLDANWRWIHGGSGSNCFTGSVWDKTLCTDPISCAENCALEGVTAEQYVSTYGVSTIQGGLELKFMTGTNAGSRLYLTQDGGERYTVFKLKNREFSFDVDVSKLPCGLNGAVYFSEMDEFGGIGGRNKAGAKFGTGYCDAQCPHDVKFMEGAANILDWNESTALGKWGACCAEMDIWEANREATAFTSHPCSLTGSKKCSNRLECGGFPDESEYRYKGVCDKDGCDFNSYRSGDHVFFGDGSAYAVDTSKPFTVVTQWITNNGKDDGDLVEIRRIYKQDGQVITNSVVSTPGRDRKDDSITDDFCDAQKHAFGDPNEHKAKGGLKAMGMALERGVVLAVSIWDDALSHMKWLDSSLGDGSKPGEVRGPCKRSAGAPEELRAKYGDASVKYTNFMFGELDSTYTADPSQKPAGEKLARPQPAPPAPAPALLAAFSQCGGKTWSGGTVCQPGCTCVASGDYYSQCTPPQGASTCGRRLRARRETNLLQRFGQLQRKATVESHPAGDEL